VGELMGVSETEQLLWDNEAFEWFDGDVGFEVDECNFTGEFRVGILKESYL
jgi:hypothetical protein